ncbi:MAG: Na+/H+ antiporter subunit E [Smithellaceae bacterium]|nr:Na+/H+ antiporter subunit E [Syntrophaceae bacterium]MDD4241785.1 Na+/H+ antiporter subunit E [Smithellaceae bacterium]NLX50560.1 Na+/H+ antiporter subunit E [Deltaproteobacteria bacterium]
MKTLRRFFPHPGLTLFLFSVWQLLMNDLSVATMIGGGICAWGIPLLTRRFWPDPPRMQKPLVALRLTLCVLGDIVAANLHVARLILGPARKLRPAFVEYPVALSDPFAVGALASIISLTPGTVTADVSPDRKTLLIHALDVADEQELIDTIKTRYEKPLQEVFPCSQTLF